METVIFVNIALEIFGSIISFILILSLILGSPEKDKLNRIFLAMLCCNIVVLISDAFALWFDGGATNASYIIIRVSNYILFIATYCFPIFYAQYITAFLEEKDNITNIAFYVVVGLSLFAIAFFIFASFYDMYYCFNEHNRYVRQDFYWISQVWGILCGIVDTFMVIWNRKRLHKLDFAFLLSYVVLTSVAVCMKIWFQDLSLIHAATTLSLVTIYIGVQAQQSKRIKEKELELTQGRVAVMLSKIQPDFMYNALSAIAHTCESQPVKARSMTIEFAEYLRENMESLLINELPTFEKELSHIKKYLSFEKAIYEDQLEVMYDIETTDFKLPSLTMQPLVERAIHHVVTSPQKSGIISISVKQLEADHVVTIEDDGLGNDLNHEVYDNIHMRLVEQCHGTLHIENQFMFGTTAIIRIPHETDVRKE